MEMPMMKCGHTAQATDTEGKKPCCVICLGNPNAEIVAEEPNLENRRARCSYYSSCRSEQPSSIKLPFFEFRGDGSPVAENQCHICGYWTKRGNFVNGKLCYQNSKKIMPTVCINQGEKCVYGAYEYDKFYCGCMGWD